MHYDITDGGKEGIMRQLTIRGVTDRLRDRLRQRADRSGLSVNRTVLLLLHQAVGLVSEEPVQVFDDLDDLAGTWSEAEAAEMAEILFRQRRVEEELWR